MIGIIILFFTVFFSDYGNESVEGYVLTEDGRPIEGAHIFFRGHLQSGVSTDSKGYFIITKVRPRLLVFSHIGYKEKEIDLEEYKSGAIKVVLKEDAIQLNEVKISALKSTDIHAILRSVKGKYIKNSCSDNCIYTVKGEHLALEESDTLLFLKSPFTLTFEDYPNLDANSHITLLMGQDSKFKKGKTYYTLPYTSEIFLVNSFKWLNIKNLKFITKSKEYDYKIQDLDSSYVISFIPLKNDHFLFNGEMKILKDSYILENYNIKLTFNKKNYFDVISTDKKHPGCRYYYESVEINMNFKKDEVSHLYHIDKMTLLAHIGRVTEKTNERILYKVMTDLQFNKLSEYTRSRNELNLMEHLYITPEKRKYNKRRPLP